MHNTQKCRRYEKNRNKKSDLRATKKGTRNPQNSLLRKLSKKLDKLEKAIKKQDAKRKKRGCSKY